MRFCKSEKVKLLYTAKDRMIRKDSSKEFYIYRCQNCGLAYLNPQPEWSKLEYFYGEGYYMAADLPQNQPHKPFYKFLRGIKRAVLGPSMPKFWSS